MTNKAKDHTKVCLNVSALIVHDEGLLNKFIEQLDRVAKTEDLTGERGDQRLPFAIMECASSIGAWALDRGQSKWVLMEKSAWSSLEAAEIACTLTGN